MLTSLYICSLLTRHECLKVSGFLSFHAQYLDESSYIVGPPVMFVEVISAFSFVFVQISVSGSAPEDIWEAGKMLFFE